MSSPIILDSTQYPHATPRRVLPVGIHYNVLAADYHADCCESPSLSSSIAKILIEKTPRHAWFAHPRLNPDFSLKHEEKFNLGAAVHELMLGKGVGYTVIDAADYRGKDAQAARQKAREDGTVPLLGEQYLQAMGIACEALRSLDEMGIRLSEYRNEAVLIWETDGVLCRAMVDSMGPGIHQIWDIKTTSRGLSDFEIGQTIARFDYDLSAAFYIKGREALFRELTNRIEFRWIFVETTPPYEIRVVEADATTLEFGRRKTEAALSMWGACLKANHWFGYPRTIGRVTYPSWAENAWLDRELTEAGIE